jgi:hypothetical protein
VRVPSPETHVALILIAGVAATTILCAGGMVFGLTGRLGWALAAGGAVTILLCAGWMFLAGAAVVSSREDLAEQPAAEAEELRTGPSDEKNSQIRLVDTTGEIRTGFKTPGSEAQDDSGNRKEGHGPLSAS